MAMYEAHQDFVIPYTAAFRNRMVAKLVGPNAMTATDLSLETGLSQPTLSRWLKEASKLRRVPKNKVERKQPQEWKPEEKLQILLEAAALPEGELGVYL